MHQSHSAYTASGTPQSFLLKQSKMKKVNIIGTWLYIISCGTASIINKVQLQKREVPEDLKDAVHGVKMGVPSLECDDGVTNTSIDWDGSADKYTCFEDEPYKVQSNLMFDMQCEEVPANVSISQHLCMDVKLEYNHTEPVFGKHRPLWPMYGEYMFVPPQRWLHNIEHGAVVMLYHPCADPQEVEKLRDLVTGCMRRHIITTHDSLKRDLPLALIVHQCRLYMSTVDAPTVVKFIRERALKAREYYEIRDGQYNQNLVIPAEIPEGSDVHDFKLCPTWPKDQ